MHHCFQLVDDVEGRRFSDHIELHTLQLPRFQASQPLDEEGRWVYFLKEARNFTELPASLDSPALRKAMSKLDDIRESTADRLRYLAREDYLHLQATLEYSRKKAEEDLKQTQEKLGQTQEQLGQTQEQLVQAEESRKLAGEGRLRAQEERLRAQAQLEEERADKERLRERMRAAGLDPDA